MKYPSFLKKGDTIGVLATSCGSNVNPYRIKTMQALKNLEKLGYKIKKGHRIYRNTNAVSAPHDIRAKDFMSFYKNKNINVLWSTGGGELMMGMLPYIDFEKISKLPAKLFIGFSDNTTLTFTLTTKCDVATLYACNITSFSYDTLHIDTLDTLSLLTNNKLSFDSYPFYQGLIKPSTPLEFIDYEEEVKWLSLSEKDEEFEGRIIGGCIDVLVSLVGTKYGDISTFLEKYKDDGFIWYFDNCELNSCGLYRALFQLKEAGFFKYVKGFLIGRNGSSFEPLGYSFKQALIDTLSSYNVPIIYDVDISHISPKIPIINGAIAKVTYKNNKGNITYKLD